MTIHATDPKFASLAHVLSDPQSRARGGIIGAVDIVDCIDATDRRAASRWFSGPIGYVLANPRPLPFLPLRGQLGFFYSPEADAHFDLHFSARRATNRLSCEESDGRKNPHRMD